VVPKQVNKTRQAKKTAGTTAKSTKAKPDPQPFWSVPQMPDLVAQNLTAQHPWWMGFADYIAEPDRGKQIFKYERMGLQNMVENKEALPTGPERAFVQACHEAWRRQLGALGERTRKEGTSFADKAQKEFDKLRVSFSRCKTAASFRETLMDFWSKAGSLPSLQAAWREVMALLNDDNWKKGKDLALLAMASYKPATKDEEAVFSVEDNSKPRGK
jgi:CRISPR-associated protein Cas8a1/Csx13